MTKPILPSELRDWSADHQRLHRLLLRRPDLLPRGTGLLLAVSGGQDSMAMLGLLRDLQPLHGWRLQLWHGDHGWRQEAAHQAAQLAAWAREQGLPLDLEHAAVVENAASGGGNREAEGRRWRYGALARAARRRGCRHVLTAHTATDRAETVLLNLARGSHRRGLASLRTLRPLDGDLLLVRPLLGFSRTDTARLCRQLGLPLWHDPGNDDLHLSRNRIRAEVLPVLEALHPGASQRISLQAERLAAELDQEPELLQLALRSLEAPNGTAAAGLATTALDRRALLRLSPVGQRRLLRHWLESQIGQPIGAEALEAWQARLPLERGPGRADLGERWQLHWDRFTLWLVPPPRRPCLSPPTPANPASAMARSSRPTATTTGGT